MLFKNILSENTLFLSNIFFQVFVMENRKLFSKRACKPALYFKMVDY